MIPNEIKKRSTHYLRQEFEMTQNYCITTHTAIVRASTTTKNYSCYVCAQLLFAMTLNYDCLTNERSFLLLQHSEINAHSAQQVLCEQQYRNRN